MGEKLTRLDISAGGEIVKSEWGPLVFRIEAEAARAAATKRAEEAEAMLTDVAGLCEVAEGRLERAREALGRIHPIVTIGGAERDKAYNDLFAALSPDTEKEADHG